MPDWEYVLWDYDKIKDIDSVWLKECLEAKKWAFAADFIRVWAVYHEGGIYLDSDVLIYNSLEPFLKDRFFIGRESVQYNTLEDGRQAFLTSHCFGAEAGHPFLKLNLAYYQYRHFNTGSSAEIPNLLRYDMTMMPYVQSRLAETYGYDPIYVAEDRQTLDEGIEVYPPCYFCWSPHLSDVHRYAQHIGQSSWREPEYIEQRKMKPYTVAYKIRWRLVVLLEKVARLLDYKIERIHPDGRL